MNRNRLFVASLLAVLALTLGAPAGLAQATSKAKGTTTAQKTAAPKAAPLDINTATKAELTALPGIGDAYSQKIISGRPYARKDQLLTKNIVPKATYDKIKNQIVATQPKP
jgi:DNA uptake protein ComE-like DNA-binding protein